MEQQVKNKACCIGLLAHVDAGKTTLSEALLYRSGELRTLGRVDHGDATLDTHTLERRRGITIFSKQALLSTGRFRWTLVDTPGHVDFAAEAERVMPVLDCAVLLISGTDGVQAHTLTLWELLARYQIPTFLFVNKMDLPGKTEDELLRQLQQELSPQCVALGDSFGEECAMCDDALLETYLQTGMVTDGNIRALVGSRKLFPVCFGSALKLQGVDALLDALDRFSPEPEFGAEFAARVYKISRDAQGNRLTWLKITGGSLKVRTPLHYVNQSGEPVEEKVQQLRVYSGDKFTAPEIVHAGQTVAVTGLNHTYCALSLGAQKSIPMPALEPVMKCRLNLPAGVDAAVFLPKLRQLAQEEPLLDPVWEEGHIHVKIMGTVQMEILQSLIFDRFSVNVTFSEPKIFYKETISDTVEGVGHFEPLRHYAEVHILLEPLPRGCGLQFDTLCSPDVLDMAWQKLILSHMAEKPHRGVLTGAPVTDIKMTLLIGRAHLKHTEGGDMRQATYRAIRQGLMQAKSVLLEPWYRFTVTTPTAAIGRAITDLKAMGARMDPPENFAEKSLLRGTVPAAAFGDYPRQLAAYTQGRGQVQIALHGYEPCHNSDDVVAAVAYQPEADLENTPDSVFCAHGAGFTVKWHHVKDYMHLESGLKRQPRLMPDRFDPGDKALEEIMRRQFGDVTTKLYRPAVTTAPEEKLTIRPPKQQYLIVDGYNIIFAWEHLKQAAKADLDAARRQLLDTLSSYAGFRKVRTVVVFDGYKVKGNLGEKSRFHNISVVFTRENETADAYIESLLDEIGGGYNIRVATSDALVQLSSVRTGVLRVSARELLAEVEEALAEMRKHFR